MDATTVQEIANQLGIGVSEVMAYLPGYASGKIIGCISIMSICIFVIIAVLIPFLICLKKANNEDLLEYKRDNFEFASWILGVLGVFVLVTVSIVIGWNIESLVMWTNAPELTFLKSLIPK